MSRQGRVPALLTGGENVQGAAGPAPADWRGECTGSLLGMHKAGSKICLVVLPLDLPLSHLPACLPAQEPSLFPHLPPALHPCLCRRIPLRLSLTFSLLEGTMCAWLPPPPGNRLFYSFVSPPTLELTARPEVGSLSPGRIPSGTLAMGALSWALYSSKPAAGLGPAACLLASVFHFSVHPHGSPPAHQC